jgi:CheY-like chemotaxis protein
MFPKNFSHNRKRLLIAEDDEDDVVLIEDSFRRFDGDIEFTRVKDGEELMEFLEKSENSLANTVLLLDLNMPRKSGKEALKEIRMNFRLRSLPIVVFSTSRADDDVKSVYALGVSSFVMKPMGDAEFQRATRSIHDYWFRTAQLPKTPS